MNKRTAVSVAILIGLLAIAAPIALSVYWSWRQSVDESLVKVGNLADDLLARNEQVVEEVRDAIADMEAAHAALPCSEENIDRMRLVAAAHPHLKAVGYVQQDRLMCSSFGRYSEGIALGPVAYHSSVGTTVRRDVHLPELPTLAYNVSTRDVSGYTTFYYSGLPLEVFQGQADLSVGVFAARTEKKILNARGYFDPAWLQKLGEADHVEFVGDDYVVAIRKSGKVPLAVFAAIPRAVVAAELPRAARVLVPIGLLAGLALAFTVFYLTKHQMAMPAVLRMALKRNEFYVRYQPIVELNGGRCVGAEALIRWRRPNGEMVRPDVFIPVAEEIGLIHEITKRVMDIVARDAAPLLKAHPDLHIGINLSPQDFLSPDTPEMIRELVQKMNVQPHNILIEATERGTMHVDKARQTIDAIHAMHIKVAIDDFGTGYSSLASLEKFKLDYLKIDKSFVDTIGGQAATSQVAVHIIEMAKALNLEMIAEGVENAQQARFLMEHGVRLAQGWYFAKPMSMHKFAQFVAGNEKLAA